MLDQIEQFFLNLKENFKAFLFLGRFFKKPLVDDSLENLYHDALTGNSASLSKLLNSADRTQHPYASYLAAQALEKRMLSSDLMQHYYFSSIQKGKTSSDIQQRKAALDSAKILSSFYTKGQHLPQSELFAEHYAYEAACLNKKAAKEFIKKKPMPNAFSQKIRALQIAGIILAHLPVLMSLEIDEEIIKDLALIEKYLNLAEKSSPSDTPAYEKQLENNIYCALAQRYKSCGMYEQAIEFYEKVHCQTPEHLPSVFEAANLYAYYLKDTKKAEQILSSALPEIRQEKEIPFFEYLKNWVLAWKNKEDKEKQTQDLVRSFEVKTLNPFREIYIHISQGVKLMAIELVEKRVSEKKAALENNKVKKMNPKAFAKHIQLYKTESPFRLAIKNIIDTYKDKNLTAVKNLNKKLQQKTIHQPELSSLHKVYIDRATEIQVLEDVYNQGLINNTVLNDKYSPKSFHPMNVQEGEVSYEVSYLDPEKTYNFYTDVDLINQCKLILQKDKNSVIAILTLNNGFINDIKNLLEKMNVAEIKAYDNPSCVAKALSLEAEILIQELNDKNEILEKENKNLKDSEIKFKTTKEKLSETQNHLVNVELRLNEKDKELDKTNKELNNTQEKLSETHNHLAKIEQRLNEKDKELNNTKEELNKTNDRLSNTQVRLTEIESIVLQLQLKNNKKSQQKILKSNSQISDNKNSLSNEGEENPSNQNKIIPPIIAAADNTDKPEKEIEKTANKSLMPNFLSPTNWLPNFFNKTINPLSQSSSSSSNTSEEINVSENIKTLNPGKFF